MPYNHTRKVTNNNNNGNNRSVSYGQGGLNERFSQLAQRSTPQHVNNNNNNNSNNSKAKPGTASVFSRLRGAKQDTPRARAKSIQSRLGKTVNGGVQKRGTKAPVKGTATGRADKRTQASLKKGVKAQQQNKKNGPQDKKKQQQQKKKPLTAEELDRAMDAYMMKDPKTAQAKLDAEITSYMDEANDLLMDEPL
ncbi:hypothetical protein EDC96DRAFT_498752 [Choanephora cucurbitarum]|nr:hypothetical protein EDC96DRAFT_498752 [Choanephora cucurbitarum]